MVYLNGVKFACATCIKGHRSTQCHHKDRELHEIKKKGRPITQCTHCRELRKTKQVHVKCTCSDKTRKDDGHGIHHIYECLDSGQTENCENQETPQCVCHDETAKVKLEPNAPMYRPAALLTPPLEQNGQSRGSADMPAKDQPTSLPSPPSSQCSSNLTSSNGNSARRGSYNHNLPIIAPKPQHPPEIVQRSIFNPTPPENKSKIAITMVIEDPVDDDMDNDTPSFTSVEAGDTQRFSELDGPASDLLETIYHEYNSADDNSLSRTANRPCCSSAISHEQKGPCGEFLRIVNCRCGDSCTCVGCLVHPGQVMTSNSDPYAGFNEMDDVRCCSPMSAESATHSAIMEEDLLLCGCGCNKPVEQCKECYKEF